MWSPAAADATSLDVHADAETAGVRVRALLDVGHDGASFAAGDEDGAFELWRLQPSAVRSGLARRLGALTRARHPSLLPILGVMLERDPPSLVVGAVERPWGDVRAWADDPAALRAQLGGLAGALAAAHALDVVHGALGLGCVAGGEDGRLVLDLTRLRVRTPRPAELAPELARGVPSAAADVWALGALVARVSSAAQDPSLRPLLDAMCAQSPEQRPSAAQVASELAVAPAPASRPASTSTSTSTPASSEADLKGFPKRLGAYELTAVIGSGGMGRVFRATDLAGGPDVAVKVLRKSWSRDAEVIERFRREARVLAQLQSPFVARFIAANEDVGIFYLVMELVRGVTAEALLLERKRLDLDLAVTIVCDVARALSEVHALGLVHRDVKPANVLVELGDGAPRVKLCDFGIARPSAETAAAEGLTRDGTPGTPSFMAPEQVEGTNVDARADVYALGATLYTLLAGRPPFVGAAHYVMVSHVTEAPPALSEHEPTVPATVEAVVMRCLAKPPGERYADARALGEALSAAWRGALATADALPQPLGIEGAPRIYDFCWSLSAEPHELWPHVSNTERLNRAAGLDDVEWTHSPGEGYVETQGSFRAAGMELRWKENPFEWVAPRRLGVVREYVSGPFEWLRSTVELDPREGGGTDLRHRIEIRPRGLIGRAAATIEVGLRLRRGLERVYQRIDASCVAGRGTDGRRSLIPPDPFEPPQRASAGLTATVDAILARLTATGVDPHVLGALAEYVCTAPAPQLARIRPRVWARQRGLPEDQVLEACLLAAANGLLEVLWDILCPSCRIPSGIEQSLQALAEHGRCEACDLDYELDLARSVELVFRAHPAIRPADLGVYCIGGPAHSPHVLAQIRLAVGERFALEVALDEGQYCIAGRGVPERWWFSVDARAPFDTWDLPLRAGAPPETPRSLAPGTQLLLLTNDLDHEVVVRLELATHRADAVTAADAASSALFRQLFPDQVLAPDRLVAISNVALLFATFPDALARYEVDEGAVHGELVALGDAVAGAARLEGGALVKLHGDGVLAVFSDRVAATRVALELAGRLGRASLALHAGAARMTTVGGRLDYFGRTVHVGELMGRWSEPGELLISEAILGDPVLAPLLAAHTTTQSYARVGSVLVGRLRGRPS